MWVLLLFGLCNPGDVRTYTPTENVNIDEWISSVLPLIHEAGNPYFDWLFGGPSAALSIIESRMRSPESEISIHDTVVAAVAGGDVIGCYIAVDGAELRRRRRGDAVAYLQRVGRAARPALLQRMQESRALFPLVAPEEFYLSKIAVRPDLRGRGYGRSLVEQFCWIGATRGHSVFVLDVCSSNIAATRLYQSLGFRVVREAGVPGAEVNYMTMRREAPIGRSEHI